MKLPVAEAQERIDSREFAEWMAYAQIEPFGDTRADLRAAIVASTVANANRGRRQRPYRPIDFMPTFEGKPIRRQQTVAEMKARFEMAFKPRTKRRRT